MSLFVRAGIVPGTIMQLCSKLPGVEVLVLIPKSEIRTRIFYCNNVVIIPIKI